MSDTAIAPLPFLIPQLDQLLGFEGIDSPEIGAYMDQATSLTLLGEDGTGKSVFALHLAAAYHAVRYGRLTPEQHAEHLVQPWVFYASSDLRAPSASRIWHNFGLNHPWHRYVPFISQADYNFRQQVLRQSWPLFHVELTPYTPDRQLGEYIRRKPVFDKPDHAGVAFLDFADRTSGDDWLFLSRLVSSLPRRHKTAPPNLLIVDSVAGFETLVGDRNSYGDNMSRRARIAQLIRASRSNWTVIFVVEEPDKGKHHPEEYVTDSVIHLRRYGQGEMARRVLEIEKSRARSFGGGEHPFEIRDGRGSSTRSWENPDDPFSLGRYFWTQQQREPNAYIQIFPSLNSISRAFGTRTNIGRVNPNQVAPITLGIPNLDEMLGEPRTVDPDRPPEGSSTCLIGGEGTRKIALAEHFLADGFSGFPELLQLMLDIAARMLANFPDDLLQFFSVQAAEMARTARLPGDGLRTRLVRQFEMWSRMTEQRRTDFEAVIRWIATGNGGKFPALRSDNELKERSGSAPLIARWDPDWYYKESDVEPGPGQKQFLVAISILRLSWGFIAPVVFISTHDSSAEAIANQVVKRHAAALAAIKLQGRDFGSVDGEDLFDYHLLRLIERFIVVRRVDFIDTTAPQLWHTIYRCSVHALTLIGHLHALVSREPIPMPFASDVRVVISDLRLIRDTYPPAVSDPLFLPTVLFRLRRLGVTAMIVDSDNGRPDQQPTHPMNGALRSLADQQIYTWKVPFFGQQRVAISAMGATQNREEVSIRELRFDSEQGGLVVDPHFELYTGIEKGEPEAVPLRIVFYEETPAFREYVEREKGLYERLFSPIRGADSVMALQTRNEYDALRDFCHLPTSLRLPYTLVFLIDSFWGSRTGGRPGSLRSQTNYLTRRFPSDCQPDSFLDPFHLFDRKNESEQYRTTREAFFRQNLLKDGKPFTAYKYRKPADRGDVDRVPFSWDFGFLLCGEKPWREAASLRFSTGPGSTEMTVGDVWSRLTTTKGIPSGQFVSWREFLNACVLVAGVEQRRTGRKTVPFDMAITTRDSLPCLLLEIWFSEILQDAMWMQHSVAVHKEQLGESRANYAAGWASEAQKSLAEFARATHVREPAYNGVRVKKTVAEMLTGGGSALCERYSALAADHTFQVRDTDDITAGRIRRIELQRALGEGYSLQLYKAWLLMIEVLDFKRYERTGHQESGDSSGSEAPAFIAARHWYKTACVSSANDEKALAEDRLFHKKVPVRLPGHFSVRGDWFAAAARGSRSGRLADQALDMLTSRRSNHTRLQMGLGLPTRDLFEGVDAEQIFTRMASFEDDTAARITYGGLLNLAGDHAIDEDGQPKVPANGPFYWLFRNGFHEFDRHTAALSKYVQQLVEWSATYPYKSRGLWRDGFPSYDELQEGNLSTIRDHPSFNRIPKGLDGLTAELNNCA